MATVPTTPNRPPFPPKDPEPLPFPPKVPEPPNGRPEPGPNRPNGARLAAGFELDDANAIDKPTTVIASTPATIQATVAL